jgi:hypothetical protein
MRPRRLFSWILLGSFALAACGLSVIGREDPSAGPAPAVDGGDEDKGAHPRSCSEIDACAPVIVFELDGGDIRSVAVDPRFVYFTSIERRTIERIDHDGGNREVLFDEMPAATIAVGADSLYWVTPTGGAAGVHRGRLDGGNDRLLLRDALGCVSVGTDRLTVGDLRSRRIVEMGFDGGGLRVLGNAANGVGQPYGVAVSPESGVVYFTHSGATALDDGGIYRIRPNIETVTLVVPHQQSPGCMAIEEEQQTIYWANYVEGAIRRSSLDGGDVGVVASGLVGPVSIVVTPEAYWYNSGNAILRQPRQ